MKRTCGILCGLALFFLAGCPPTDGERSAYPLGLWEFQGALPDGKEGVVRAEIVEGPFLRLLGFHAPLQEISTAELAEVKENAERFWQNAPEMLMQFDGKNFLWLGGDHDGKLLLEVIPEGLRSHRADTFGLVLRPVEQFTPLQFPRYEASIAGEND